MRKGLAASTIRTYDFAWFTFATFCASLNLPLKPVLIKSVCAFITYCTDVRHFKPQYIRGLLAGVQFNVRCYDPSFPSLFSNPSIKLLLKGISKCFPQPQDNRRPITLSILHDMVSVLRKGLFSPHIDSLLISVFLLAFHGFLRISEFTSSSNTFDPVKDICFSDLSFHPSHYCLSLKHSKAKGACSIVIASTGSSFCPYRAMLRYLRLRSSFNSLPLFLTPSNNPMSKAWFLQHFQKVLLQCHLSPQHYSGHSFRIGAATSAAMQGISSASLQQMGRWSSSAYASYIRPDSASILAAQRNLKL